MSVCLIFDSLIQQAVEQIETLTIDKNYKSKKMKTQLL